MPFTKMYMLQFYGDLPTNVPQLCSTPVGYASIEDALQWLKEHVLAGSYNDADDMSGKFWFDDEDDRIVIWELAPGEPIKAVWHASGFHWDYNASDLPGGPLEQGNLPGDEESLYDKASTE